MVQAPNFTGPYAPARNVLDVVHRMRDRGLPETVDLTTLGTIGIPEGNQARTLAALKFLGLVNEDNTRSELFTRLGRASTDEYPQLMAEILRDAYAPVFEIVEPGENTETQVFDAFRRYEPASQRQRMVTLFMTLCAEAGIVSQDAIQTRKPSAQPRRNTPRAGRTPKSATTAKTRVNTNEDGPDLRAIHGWIDQLPPEGWWTAAKRDRWLNALTAAVDYAIEVRDQAPLVATEEEGDEEEE